MERRTSGNASIAKEGGGGKLGGKGIEEFRRVLQNKQDETELVRIKCRKENFKNM